MELSIRYVHKIAPRDSDVRSCNTIDADSFSGTGSLARALRARGLLAPGTRLRSVRREADRVIVFPDRGIWHSLVITFVDAAKADEVQP